MTDVVVDTSAAVALLTGEEDGGSVAHAMGASDRLLMSAGTLVELGIVLEARFGPVGAAVLERFLRAGPVQVVGFDQESANTAIDGWRRYGKGRHPAALNFGDCFVYALATIEGASVLCVGEDFQQTDVTVVGLT